MICKLFPLMLAISTTLIADSDNITPEQPQIKTRFFSAEAIKGIPKLEPLEAQDPGFNKILIKLEGFPKNKEIIGEIKRIAGDTPGQYQQIIDFKIQEDGSIVTDKRQKLRALVGSGKGFLPGERVFYRFRTADGSIDKEISGIPNPVIARNKKGKIEATAELISLSPTVYLLDFPQMEEGDKYEIISSSLGATVKAKGVYSKGKPIHYSPEAKKGKGGTASLKIKKDSSKETYALTLPWGTAFLPYLHGDESYPYKEVAPPSESGK